METEGSSEYISTIDTLAYVTKFRYWEYKQTQNEGYYSQKVFHEDRKLKFLCLSHLGTFLEEETKLERHLPSNINILSLENWTSSEVLMRLQYLGEKQKNLNLDPREILQKKYVKCHVTDMVGMRKIRDNCFNIIFQPLEIVTLILSWNDWMTNSKYLFCEDCISYQKLSSRIRIPTHFILVKV